MKITLRTQQVKDAKRFFEILNNPRFLFWSEKPASIKDEESFIRKNILQAKKKFTYSYTILLGKKVVGGCGIKIDQHRRHIGELGFFVDEKYWGKGIATVATQEMEKLAFEKLNLFRLVVLMNPKNLASEKVAIKCGYTKEGLMKGMLKRYKYRGFSDALLYAKIKPEV